jgi:folate-binding protein YgfZ
VSADEAVRAARAGAVVVPLVERALLEVTGADRVRFLQGQLTNDVAALAAAGPRNGCYALALTAQGRIVADLHVLAREGAFWLETHAAVAPAATARLEKYVIADDVAITDRSAERARFAVEGPRARALVADAFGGAVDPAPESWAPLGAGGLAAAFGWSGEDALQLLVPAGERAAAEAALRAAAARHGAVWAEAGALEVLRVEAGIPRAGAELGEDVLPAEARVVERAVSFTKGCYTGQEVVTRMQTRARVGHLLVGLALAPAGGSLPAPGAALLHEGARVGELTSVVRSPSSGPIALGFVRVARSEPGTVLALEGGGEARVAALPFVRPTSGPA